MPIRQTTEVCTLPVNDHDEPIFSRCCDATCPLVPWATVQYLFRFDVGGLLLASSLTLNRPVRVPVAVRVKVTPIVHLELAVKLVVHVVRRHREIYGSTPTPVNATVCGALKPLSVIVNVRPLCPTPSGVKVTFRVHFFPMASVAPHVVRKARNGSSR